MHNNLKLVFMLVFLLCNSDVGLKTVVLEVMGFIVLVLTLIGLENFLVLGPKCI